MTLEKVKSNEGEIQINQYKVLKELGEGAFGKVMLCQDTKNL